MMARNKRWRNCSAAKIKNNRSLVEPVAFEKLPHELQDLLGARASDQCTLFGVRAGQLHLVLAQAKNLKDFASENFSLHYQRSLFSSMLALVRETYNTMQKDKSVVHDAAKQDMDELLGRKNEMLSIFKKIYSR